jgi:GTPase SAR1 family protein
MVGAKYSGKSHYVASLVHRLEGRGATDMYSALMPLGDHTIRRYKEEFYQPLFEDRLELPATAGAPPPLVYDMTFDEALWQDERGRSVTPAFYDTAGENFANQALVSQMVKYLQVASGIIFLVDPTQSKGIQHLLPDELRKTSQDDNADPHEIISRVVAELVKSNVLGPDQPLDKPVAMVLTKCDVLQQCGLIPENRLWTMDQRHIGKFRKEIHEDMSGMIGELLWRTNLPAYNEVKMRFPRHAFFGVSSTGCAPNKRGRFPFIAPWRVVDPLFWLLAELGVIPLEEHWAYAKKNKNGK